MKKLFFLWTFLLVLSLPGFSQDHLDEDHYPATDPASIEDAEFPGFGKMTPTDYEDVPREEQEYIPQRPVTEEIPPEEIYEEDEEYLE